MKRHLSIILTVLMVLGCFGGCGASDTNTVANTTETTNTVEENAGESVEVKEGSEENAQVSEEAKEGSEADAQDGVQVAEESGEKDEGASAEIEEQLSIRELFAEHGLKAGTCLTTRMISNKKLSELVTTQFSSVTMENDMKPDYIFNKKESQATGELVLEFNDNMIKMLDWAKENDMAVRGHTLIWYSQTPGWIFHEGYNITNPLVDREEMLRRMESMIKQMFEKLTEEGYIDLFYAYDIVNEAWMEDGQMRKNNNQWYEIIGDDYLWYAFYYANMYAPESIDLYYNDYNEQYKTETLVKFVDTLKDEAGNSLIDGIGLQAHLYTQDDIDAYFRCVDRLAETGLKIQLTELDVCLGAYQKIKAANEDNLQKQGRYYYDLINGIFERVDNGTLNCDALTFWGFSDGMSWRKEYSPLLYDATYQPKYAYYGVMQIKEKCGY